MNIRLNKITLAIAIALTAIAAATWFYMLHFSLLPHPKPPKLLSIDIEQLKPSHLLTYETESLRYFVIRSADGSPYVLAVPIREGELYLPNQYWWKPHYVCRDFALEITDGVVNDKSLFHCRDKELPEEWLQRWHWNAQGKHVGSGNKMDDMYRVNFKRSGDELTFTGLVMN